MRNNLEANKDYYLSFSLDKEIFAVSVYKVLEVLENQKMTEVPKSPDYIKGVINFRGEILPVIDMRKKFCLPEQEDDSKYVIIVLDLRIGSQKLILGAMTDGVRDVLEIEKEKIGEVPEMGSNYNTEFINGMYHFEDKFMMLLNIDKVFESDDLLQMNQAVGNNIETEEAIE